MKPDMEHHDRVHLPRLATNRDVAIHFARRARVEKELHMRANALVALSLLHCWVSQPVIPASN